MSLKALKLFLAGVACTILMPLSASAADCPANALNVQGSLQCTCPANGPNMSIWGTGMYTADSNICTAARHAGAVSTAGGEVMVSMAPGQNSYQSTQANGISSGQWNQYGSSFTVTPVMAMGPEACSTIPSGVDVHECTCAPGAPAGSVWGSDPYTDDSNLCTAARHSGVIGENGGLVRAMAVSGLESYRGSAWNGVSTSDYGSWGRSVTFDRN